MDNNNMMQQLKPSMSNYSGHSCAKIPANLVPLFKDHCAIKPNVAKNLPVVEINKNLTDDFAEFEDFENDGTISSESDDEELETKAKTKVTTATHPHSQSSSYVQQAQQQYYHQQQQQQQQRPNTNQAHPHNGPRPPIAAPHPHYHHPNQQQQMFYQHQQQQQQQLQNQMYHPNVNKANINQAHAYNHHQHHLHQHHPQPHPNPYQHPQQQPQLYQHPQSNYLHEQYQQQQLQQRQILQQSSQSHLSQKNEQIMQQQQQQQQQKNIKQRNIADTLLKAQAQQQKKRGEVHFPATDLRNKYEFVRYLGHGSYGHVAEARSLCAKHKFERVAIKKVPNVFRNVQDAKRLLREMVILRTLREHEAIIGLIDILPPADIENFDTMYLVFEFVDTDLSKLIASPQNFQRLHAQYVIYQILLGIKFMHSAGIVHRDLKPANILVNENVSTKVCDFGLARGISEKTMDDENRYPVPKCQNKFEIKRQFKETKQMEKEDNKAMQRQLTKHVVTRWYRAPEVILFSQRRESLTAIDMWSVGCIFSELLAMAGDDAKHFQNRSALFPGRSCFPLSARDPEAYKDRFDQLNCIFSVIGTPSPKEIAKVKDAQARAYLQKLADGAFQNPCDLSKKFANAGKEELDLLKRLLAFDVEKRITVDEALAHPFLAEVRDLQAERRHKNVVYDFEDVSLDISTIYKLIVDEICQYNPDLVK